MAETNYEFLGNENHTDNTDPDSIQTLYARVVDASYPCEVKISSMCSLSGFFLQLYLFMQSAITKC